jgi:guanylate kinase
LNKGKLFVITAPSGAGKTSLIEALVKADPSLQLSISRIRSSPRASASVMTFFEVP